MDPELQKLLGAAQAALQAGTPASEVNTAIRNRTGGKFTTVEALQQVASPPREGFLSGARRRRQEAFSFGDQMRLAAQGATFGFADEIVGLMGGDAEASRARVQELRDRKPVASFAAEALGGAVVPGGVGGGVGRAAVRATGNRIIGAVTGGGVGGAVGGTLAGAGEADPGNRVAGAFVGGTIGALAGGALGGVAGGAGRAASLASGGRVAGGAAQDNARSRLLHVLEQSGLNPAQMREKLLALGPGSVAADAGDATARLARAAVNDAPSLADGAPMAALRRRAADRGERLAEDVRGASGLTRSFDESVEAAKASIEATRAKWYRPLEEKYTSVTGDAILDALKHPQIARAARRVSPDIAPSEQAVRALNEMGVPEKLAKDAKRQTMRPATFRELQDVLGQLRDEANAARASGRPHRAQKAQEALDIMLAALEADIPEFPAAQRAYMVAKRTLDAHKQGQQMARKHPREIRQAMDALPEEAQDAFRMGMLDRLEAGLREKVGGGGDATRLQAAGRTEMERLRLLVGSDEGLERLLSGTLEREHRWTRTWNALQGNSTTAQQLGDRALLPNIPSSTGEAAWQIATSVFHLTPAERVAAAEMIGRVLLSDGREAAEQLAKEMTIRASMAGGSGGASGATLVRDAATERGLFD
jgi:hypothetical protein